MMADDTASEADEYAVPRPSKIKLKETRSERAQKLYDREVRRQRKRDHLISRANGYAVSPPRQQRGESESLTPPRHRPTYDEVGTAKQEQDEMEKRERMAYLEQEELDRLESNPFASYSTPMVDVHVPKRFRPNPEPSSSTGGSRDAIRELRNGGTVPALGSMNDDEYTTFIRQGMERLRNLAEADERDTREREKQKKAEERLRREEADEKRRQERRERRRAKAKAKSKGDARPSSPVFNHSQPYGYRYEEDDVGEILRESKSLERQRYINLWASLAGEIQQVEMRYQDIPWPVYGGRSIEKTDVRTFLFDLAGDKSSAGTSTASNKDREKKVLRDAIRIFHPDRFFGRFLDRVRQTDRERVKEGVEKCSRVINDLAAENAAR